MVSQQNEKGYLIFYDKNKCTSTNFKQLQSKLISKICKKRDLDLKKKKKEKKRKKKKNLAKFTYVTDLLLPPSPVSLQKIKEYFY